MIIFTLPRSVVIQTFILSKFVSQIKGFVYENGEDFRPLCICKGFEDSQIQIMFDFISVLTNSFHHDNTDFQGWYLIIQYKKVRVQSIEGFPMD